MVGLLHACGGKPQNDERRMASRRSRPQTAASTTPTHFRCWVSTFTSLSTTTTHLREFVVFKRNDNEKKVAGNGWGLTKFFFFFLFSSVGKKSGSIYTFFQRHFLVIGSRSLPSFYFLSGKFFWFKYRTLVLPYYTHLLRAANIPYWLTHPVCVCVCEDTSQKCQEEVGMWETGQLKIDTDWLRK